MRTGLLKLLHPLDRKLMRDLWHMKGQAIAIALVIAAGVGMYVMSKGMLISLENTRDAYYERYRFADLYAPAKRAPQSLLDRIQAIPGVRRAETRVRAGVLMDVAGSAIPITGQLLSLPAHRDAIINDILLTAGRELDPLRPDEVLLLDSFAAAHELGPGDELHAIINGKSRRLEVVGLAMGPEFVYAISPGNIVPDAAQFGVGWMNRKALASAFDLDGAFNEALILSAQNANQDAIIAELDDLLRRFGGSGAFDRDLQLSDRYLSSEIRGLQIMGDVLPPIFLLVAAFLLNVVIARLIQTEREQIGLLKAFGYRNTQLAQHYLKFSGLIALLGILIGSLLGRQLGQGLALIYMDYFKFPFLLFDAPTSVYLIAAGISIIAAILGSLQSVRTALRLQPAVAMAPAPPPDYSGEGRWMDRFGGHIDQPSRMILRHLSRWPARALLTGTGIAVAMGLYVGASFQLDAIDRMIDISFNVSDRQDATVSFVEARHRSGLQEIRRAPGVLYAEPFRSVPAILHNGPHSRREGILGIGADADLSRMVDMDLKSVVLPDAGLVLSAKLADLLDVSVGQSVRVEITEGRRPQQDVQVAAIAQTYMGTSAYMSLPALNRLMHEDGQISGAHLLIDDAQSDALFTELKSWPSVAGVSLQEEAQQAFYDTLDESMGTMVFFNTFFAALIVIGVVYNSARVSLSERGRELASLRVLGLTRAEVSYILLGELALLTLLALPAGAALGYGLAASIVSAFDTDLYRIPLVIKPSTYGSAALVVILSAVISGLIVRRRIDTLDLVAVLKTRE